MLGYWAARILKNSPFRWLRQTEEFTGRHFTPYRGQGLQKNWKKEMEAIRTCRVELSLRCVGPRANGQKEICRSLDYINTMSQPKSACWQINKYQQVDIFLWTNLMAHSAIKEISY